MDAGAAILLIKGLGLGLEIVRRVADLPGCEVNLHSVAGRVSCFEVMVPRAIEATVPLTAAVDKPHTISSTGLVVVIDDEKAIRAGMSGLLVE